MRADRLVSLLLLMQSRGRVTAAEAAAVLEVSVPTARRDLGALSAAGVPVYAQPGRGGGWSLVGGARTDLTGLTGPEVQALFLLTGPAATASPEVRSALRKLVRALPATFREQAETASGAVVVDPRRWGAAPATRPPYLDPLERAVVHRQRVELGYRDHAGTASTRRVEPLGLVDKDGVWYLLAGTTAGRRTFRVDRVVAVDETGETFDRPPDLDLTTAWAEVQAEVDRRRGREVATVTLPDHLVRVFSDQVGARYVDVLEAADVRTRLRVHADTTTMLARQLAGWADVVEVEGPDAVRAELARFGGLLAATDVGRTARRTVSAMPLRRAMPVLRREDPEQTRAFWVDLLGFEPAVDEPGFMILVSPDVETTQLIVGDASVSADAADKLRDVDVSVDVGDVDTAYAEAQARGFDIVYPITTESWGPRRFFVRLPGGTVVNVVGH